MRLTLAPTQRGETLDVQVQVDGEHVGAFHVSPEEWEEIKEIILHGTEPTNVLEVKDVQSSR